MNTSRRPAAALTLGGLATLSCLLVAPPGAQALATACSITPAATDYNGDGFDDAAIGDPEATVDGVRRAGAVTVLLGDADGRIGEGSARTVVTRASFGETPVAGDRFGHDVALAVTGRNGRCADLLVGSPGVDVGRSADAGTVHLISDLPDVEGTPQLQALPLTQVAVGGDAEAGDQFGHALSWSGPDPQGRSTLLVGAPGEDVGAATDAGSVSVHRLQGGDLQGLAELRQGRGLPGTAQTGDRLGQALAAGLVGAPGDTVSGRRGAGSVTLLRGPGRPALQLSQSTAGVPGTAEVADGFGASVAVEPASGTLAVGSPGEDAGRTSGTGSVTLFHAEGAAVLPGRSFHQATPGVPGANEAGDHFGSALAFGHHARTLLVGIPGEDVGRIRDAGAVQPVTLGSSRTLRFPPSVTENAPGTAGSVGTDNRFGTTLGSLSGSTEDLLTIASPYALRGSVYVLSDGARVPARSWVPAAGASWFGWSVSN